jgi:putative methyltransferase (TIGR04325 family)
MCVANLFQNELREASSWQEAVEKSKGYDDASLIDALASQFRENLIIRNNILDNTSWSIRKCHLILGWKLSCGNIDTPRIADFGGGNGYMFDWIKSAQVGGQPDYTVFESYEIAKAYSKIENDLGITFLPDHLFNESLRFNLTILSCTLQYLEHWEELLVIALKNSRFVLIMRTPVINSTSDSIFIQEPLKGIYKDSSASWPIRFLSRKKLLAVLDLYTVGVFSALDFEETFPYMGNQYPHETYLVKSKE